MPNPFEFKNNLSELVDEKVLRRVNLTNEILQEFRIPLVLENGVYKSIQDEIRERQEYLLSVSANSGILPGEIKVLSEYPLDHSESAPLEKQEDVKHPDSQNN